jgi:hypothetical protein
MKATPQFAGKIWIKGCAESQFDLDQNRRLKLSTIQRKKRTFNKTLVQTA